MIQQTEFSKAKAIVINFTYIAKAVAHVRASHNPLSTMLSVRLLVHYCVLSALTSALYYSTGSTGMAVTYIP